MSKVAFIGHSPQSGPGSRKSFPSFRGQFLTTLIASPQGVQLFPWGELDAHGRRGLFTPLFSPRGEHSIMLRRMKG
jgi:hypothetical protein